MACTQKYVDYVVEQINNAGLIEGKKMFGGYSMYSDGILFAIICDDKLFVKPTE
jgi:TfoX/Sxy family transcriptional regulator of competence genes